MLSEILKTNRGARARSLCRRTWRRAQRIWSALQRSSALRGSSRNGKTPCTNLESERAHGSRTGSTKDRSSLSAGTCRADPFDSLIVGYYEGNKLMYAAKVRNGFVPQVRREVSQRFKGLQIDLCPFRQSSRKETHAMGANERGNEKLPVAQTRAGGADRVRGVDAGRSFEAFEICGVEGGQRPR
jgi:hypothetical protein